MNTQTGRACVIAFSAWLMSACSGGEYGNIDLSYPVVTPPTAVIDKLRFNNTDFDEVEVSNSFAMIVQYGDRFGIEIDIDRNYSHLVSVDQDGVRLKIRFDPSYQGDIRANVARGIVTLPSLQVIDANGSAIVDFAGFTQSYVQIRQNGSSRIEGSNSQFEFIDANLGGSSRLTLSSLRPLPAVNIQTNGSSRATLYMMDGGTLTGSAAGSSRVGYYGTGVSNQVMTVQGATVTWLGSNAP